VGGGLYNHESSVMSGLQRSCVWGSLFESYIGSCGVVLGSQSQWSAVELGSPGQRQGAGICTSLVFELLHS